MTFEEMHQLIEEAPEYHTVKVSDEELELYEDLNDAHELLGTCQDLLEGLIKRNRRKRFLTDMTREEIKDLLVNIDAHLSQWAIGD